MEQSPDNEIKQLLGKAVSILTDIALRRSPGKGIGSVTDADWDWIRAEVVQSGKGFFADESARKILGEAIEVCKTHSVQARS